MEHCCLEKIHRVKWIFIKSFVVSVVILWLSAIISMLFYSYLTGIAESWFGLDKDDYSMVFVFIFGLWKIMIIQFTLVPAIVFAWIEMHMKHKKEQQTEE